MVLLIITSLLLLYVSSQTNQKVAMCALQSAFNYPNLPGWSQNNCQAFGAAWTDDDIRLQNWTGVFWRQRPSGASWDVTVIDIQNTNLTGFIPPEIRLLSNLSQLNLAYNQLSGTIPTELASLPVLKVLVLAVNKFSGTIPLSIYSIPGLRYLVLPTNKLSGTIATEIIKLNSSLLGFDVSENQITGTLPNEFYSLRNLDYLSLHTNLLSGTISSFIGNFVNLGVFFGSINQFSGSLPSELGKCTKLVKLDIQRNLFTGTLPSELSTLNQNLQILYLAINDFSGDPTSVIGTLTSLRGLWLSQNRFTGPVSTMLSPLPLLEEAFLSHNFFTGDITFSLPPTLSLLQIAQNRLSGPVVIQDHQNIQSILLDGNNISSLTLINNQVLYTVHAQDNTISTVNLNVLPQLLRIELANNSISTFPDFLLYASSASSLATVGLRGNQIVSLPSSSTVLLNTALYDVDLSYNQFVGSTITFLFYTPTAATHTNGTSCFCIPAPSQREIIMLANRLTTSTITISEITGDDYYSPRIVPGLVPSLPVCSSQFTENSGLATCTSDTSSNFLVDNFASVDVYPQDFDECSPPNTHGCEQLCLDGWFPVLNYTCGCNPGFLLTNDQRTCFAINPTQNIALIIGPVVGASVVLLLLLAIILVVFLYYYKQTSSNLKLLPKEIAWSFLDFEENPSSWSFHGTEKQGVKHGYYFKECDKEGTDRVMKMMANHLGNYGSQAIAVLTIAQIYNVNLTTSFINQWRTISARASANSSIFANESWRSKGNAEEQDFRGRVNESYLGKARKYEWNANLANEKEYISLGVHGTDYFIAQSIAQTGFANISSLDEGFYGKGIYFSSSILYCFPYFSGMKSLFKVILACELIQNYLSYNIVTNQLVKRNPAIILSYLTLGNVYPVIEHHRRPNNLTGGTLMTGSNSHYVCTDRTGCVYPFDTSNDEVFDEIVIFQESQVVPAFILEINPESFPKLLVSFTRETPSITPTVRSDIDHPSITVSLDDIIERDDFKSNLVNNFEKY